MCNKNVEDKQRKRSSTVGVTNNKGSSDRKKKRKEESTKISSNLGPSHQKTRTKRRKPKYLSLKLELISSHDHEPPKNKNKKTNYNNKKKMTNTVSLQEQTHMVKKKGREGKEEKQEEKQEEKEQLNLFPLQPENLVEKDCYCYQNDAVTAYLFNSTTYSTTISSIHDLLDSTTAAAAAATTSGDGPLLSPQYQDNGSSSSLVRTAMRRGASEEADGTEERWVSYSEVVEEVMSRSGTPRWGSAGEGDEDSGIRRLSLALKLDYQHIMEAWSDKGPFYVEGEPPQTVPELHAGGYTNGVVDGWGSLGSLWVVPEGEETERWKKGRREASLLRYKEKRQSRLFSKRVRYEVRKLNAEKRPRIKGRFVRRVDK